MAPRISVVIDNHNYGRFLRAAIDSILAQRLGITGGPLAAIARINLNDVGFWIVGLFAATWVVALIVWRLGRIEERWSASLTD